MNNFEKFLNKANEKFNNKFDYSKFVFNGWKNKIINRIIQKRYI